MNRKAEFEESGRLRPSGNHMMIAIPIVGPNGSGKSSAVAELLDLNLELLQNGQELEMSRRIACCLRNAIVNPDAISKRLRVEHPNWTQEKADFAAQAEADTIRRIFMDGRVDFAFETVGSHISKLEFLYELKAAGYFIVLLFVGTESPDISMRRVRKRAAEGGHNVPEQKIEQRWYRTMELLPRYFEAADFAVIYDNSVEAKYRGDQSARLLVVKGITPGAVRIKSSYHEVKWIQKYLPL